MEKQEYDFIYKAFDNEGLQIVDEKQIEEIKRWFLIDFMEPVDYKYDSYISDANIISVCGSGRSGTTLMRVMLDSHPDIYSGPESFLLLPLKLDAKDLSTKFKVSEKDILNLQKVSESRSQFVEKFKNLILEVNKKTIWADKTVRNIHCISYIHDHFPNAKIINVVRDPRDSIASLRTHKKRKFENGQIKNTGYVMPLDLCIDRWNKAISDSLPHRNKKYYLEVRYEDLVLYPEKTLSNVCNFCGVKFDNEMLNFHEIVGPTRDYKNFIQNIEATKPLSKESIGRYTVVLNLQQIEFIEEQTKKNASIIGYEI